MITLPNDIEDRVQAQVASGAFTSKEEVLRQAMDTLERRQQSLEELRSLVQTADADIAAGRVGKFDVDRTMRSIHEQVAGESNGE